MNITRYGKVVVEPGGSVTIEDFSFSGADANEAAKAAVKWAIQKLQEALKESVVRDCSGNTGLEFNSGDS